MGLPKRTAGRTRPAQQYGVASYSVRRVWAMHPHSPRSRSPAHASSPAPRPASDQCPHRSLTPPSTHQWRTSIRKVDVGLRWIACDARLMDFPWRGLPGCWQHPEGLSPWAGLALTRRCLVRGGASPAGFGEPCCRRSGGVPGGGRRAGCARTDVSISLRAGTPLRWHAELPPDVRADQSDFALSAVLLKTPPGARPPAWGSTPETG